MIFPLPALRPISRMAALFALGSMSIADSTRRAEDFVAYEIDPGGEISSVTIKDFDGDGKPDLVLTVNKIDGVGVKSRWLLVYSESASGFVPIAEMEVPDDAIAFGLGDFAAAGRPQVVYFTSRSVVAVDPATGALKRLLEDQRFIFNRPQADRLAYWDYIQDLNGDARDDLIFADATGYVVYLQNEDGSLKAVGRIDGDSSFATRSSGTGYSASVNRNRRGRGVSLGGLSFGADSEDGAARTREIETRRRIGRLIVADANGDGRVDLLILRGGRLRTYEQRADGTFPARASSGPGLRSRGGSDFSTDGSNLAHADVDADGRVDFVSASAQGAELSTRIQLHLSGAEGPTDEPDQIIKLSGLGEAPQLIDVNGDGLVDLAYLTLSAGKILSLRASSVERIEVAYSVFLFDAEAGTFSRRPDVRREIELELNDALDRGQARKLIRFDGDFNGDGVNDLLVFENKGEIMVYPCTAEGGKLRLASRPSMRHDVRMPENAMVTDLGGDGRSDLILVYDRTVRILRPQ